METNKKFTDSYAYELAEDYEKNNGNLYSMGIDQAFYSGYMRAIEETAASELLDALEELVYELTGEQQCEDELEKGLGIPLFLKVMKAKNAIKKAKKNNEQSN